MFNSYYKGQRYVTTKDEFTWACFIELTEIKTYLIIHSTVMQGMLKSNLLGLNSV